MIKQNVSDLIYYYLHIVYINTIAWCLGNFPVRTISPEENSSLVRVRVWVRVGFGRQISPGNCAGTQLHILKYSELLNTF